LAEIVTHIRTEELARKGAAKELEGGFYKDVAWASVAPDNALALLGRNVHGWNSEVALEIVRIADKKTLFRAPMSDKMVDILWLPEGGKVLILEGTEHTTLTPWALISAVSGHPVRKLTFQVHIIDLSSYADDTRDLDEKLISGCGKFIVVR
jgi:hypothetical protein